jgi:hypothetical protein
MFRFLLKRDVGDGEIGILKRTNDGKGHPADPRMTNSNGGMLSENSDCQSTAILEYLFLAMYFSCG